MLLNKYFDGEKFPKLLVMIFGRDELNWGEDWQPLLEQYQLLEFDDRYSKQYLQETGIQEVDIVDVIIRGSKGFPLLLYLSSETYANMKNAGKEPSIGDFGGSYPEIIERFLYNLDKDTVEVLRLMSVPNYYDTDIFDVLIKEFNISFPITKYEQFNKYSFVNYDEKEKVHYIHALIRTSILERSPERVVKSAHLLLLRYYTDLLGETIKTKYVHQMFYHAHKSVSVTKFNEWLVSPISTKLAFTPIDGLKKQQERGEQSVLIQIIDSIRSDYKLNDLRIELVNIYIDVVHLGGDYDLAVDICEKYLSSHSTDEIYKDQQLLKMRIRKIHHSMFFKPVNELILDAEDVINSIDDKIFTEEYNELLFLLGGNLGILSGDFDYATKWLDKSLGFALENKMEAFVHRTIRKQADILLYNDDFEKALKLVNRIIDKDTTIDDITSRYKIYLMAALGEIYRKRGELEIAWNCFEIVDKKCTENYMPGWQAHSYLAKGLVCCMEERYEDAVGYFDRALVIYKKIEQEWGIINTNEALLLLQKSRGESLLKADVEDCKTLSERMNYQYNVEFAEKLSEDGVPYLQLFFL